MINILDCTLRDGGYYTSWDFDTQLVEDYLAAMELLPVEFVELGYRSTPQKQYEGEYCYLPLSTLKRCKALCPSKKLAIMINLKDVDENSVVLLLGPCVGYVDLVRLAVRPDNLAQAAKIANVIKSMGFLVAINIMYMSTWKSQDGFYDSLHQLEGTVDYVWMVDSYGAVQPNDMKIIIENVKKQISCSLGFHGHNNLELAMANSLEAINLGCQIIDSTILGMGRGAGNLKTELLLTYLQKIGWDVDFYKLSNIVELFHKLQQQYHWGTNIPYMISGANSLPQKDIMEMMSKRRYSVTSIVEILQNAFSKQNQIYPKYAGYLAENTIVIGGGPSVKQHRKAIIDFIKQNDLFVVFASAKHIDLISEFPEKPHVVCLVGEEGHKLENHVFTFTTNTHFIVNTTLKTDTYVPENLKQQIYNLPITQPELPYSDSPLSIALQLVGVRKVWMIGFDGYLAVETNEDVYDLMQENQRIIDAYQGELISLLPTAYKNIKQTSIYSYL